MIARFVRRNWPVVFFVVLILLMLFLAPQEEMKFIYTEF
jgi:hypothetical protein